MIKQDLIELDVINNSLRDNGYVIVKNFLTENTKNRFKEFVVSKIRQLNRDRFSINENELENTVISEFINSLEFTEFCENFEEKNKFHNLKFNSHYLINFTRKKKRQMKILVFIMMLL